LLRLFEMEVPEIYDGTVVIKSAVREPGERAKIAVMSNERDVDPVGACVGMKGSRVQAIIRELRGERIDIIEWSEDPAVFAANALSPAKVSKVEINSFEDKKLTVTVPEDQLSLAIGKKGQNVRLAAKLVGWHIDIRSAEEAARAAAVQLEAVMAGGEASLADIRESLALDQITAQRLKDRGIETIEQLSGMGVDELVDAIDVSFDQANEILDRAHRLLAQKHAREAQAAKEAAAPEQAEQAEAGAAAEAEVAPEAEAGHGVSVSEEGAEGAEHDAAQVESGAGAEAAPEAGLEGETMPEETSAAATEAATEAASEATGEESVDPSRLAEPEPSREEVADELDEERQYAPPPDAEPSPARPEASAVPNYGAMSPSEAQIQEVLADAPVGSEAEQGPMPASGLAAFAPGERVIPETHREWAEESGIAESREQSAEELVESFRDDLTLEDVQNVTGETRAGDESDEKSE
jgi:N utilization substance protein A